MTVSAGKKLDDVDWHVAAIAKDLPEEERLAYARAHLQVFVYWLATRGMLTKANTPTPATVKNQEKLGAFIEETLDDKIIFSMISSKYRDFVDAYYFGFYLKELDDSVLKGRDVYAYLPTTADCEAVAVQIDKQFEEYTRDPAGFTKRSKGYLRKIKLRRRIWLWVWLVSVVALAIHFALKFI